MIHTPERNETGLKYALMPTINYFNSQLKCAECDYQTSACYLPVITKPQRFWLPGSRFNCARLGKVQTVFKPECMPEYLIKGIVQLVEHVSLWTQPASTRHRASRLRSTLDQFLATVICVPNPPVLLLSSLLYTRQAVSPLQWAASLWHIRYVSMFCFPWPELL